MRLPDGSVVPVAFSRSMQKARKRVAQTDAMIVTLKAPKKKRPMK
jgi:hypothetical protein